MLGLIWLILLYDMIQICWVSPFIISNYSKCLLYTWAMEILEEAFEEKRLGSWWSEHGMLPPHRAVEIGEERHSYTSAWVLMCSTGNFGFILVISNLVISATLFYHKTLLVMLFTIFQIQLHSSFQNVMDTRQYNATFKRCLRDSLNTATNSRKTMTLNATFF